MLPSVQRTCSSKRRINLKSKSWNRSRTQFRRNDLSIPALPVLRFWTRNSGIKMSQILNKIGTSDQINHQDEMNLGSWHGLVSFFCNWSKINKCIFKWYIWYQYIFRKSLIFKKKQLFVHFGNHLGWFS